MIVLALLPSRNTNNANNELHDHHACSTNDEDSATAEALDCPEGDRCGAHVDEGGDEGDEEGIADRPEGGKENRAEVEDEIDTRKLLHHLHENT